MKEVAFEKSILAKIGWSQKDYIDVVINMASMKMANNIPLTPTESWIYLNKGDFKNGNIKSRNKIKS